MQETNSSRLWEEIQEELDLDLFGKRKQEAFAAMPKIAQLQAVEYYALLNKWDRGECNQAENNRILELFDIVVDNDICPFSFPNSVFPKEKI